MLIEAIPQVELDKLLSNEGLLSERLRALESEETPVVILIVSLDNWDHLSRSLCTFRASNISALLSLKTGGVELDQQEMLHVFSWLWHWDQMLLCNFLEICNKHIPEKFKGPLLAESKLESKWYAEWMMASYDQRIHKYPGLPWRRFARKIVSENFAFAQRFLEILGQDLGSPERDSLLEGEIRRFLEEKKKAVCIFPKRWGRS